MAKYGINRSLGLKAVGILDVRSDEDRAYVEVEGETYSLASLLEEYDGQDVEIKTSKEILPDDIAPEENDEE